MKTLLRIEWLKLKHYGAFKIIFLLFGIGIFLSNYIVYSVNKNLIEKSGQIGTLIGFTPYSFYNTWQTTSYASGYLLILPAMLMIIKILCLHGYNFYYPCNIIYQKAYEYFISRKYF